MMDKAELDLKFKELMSQWDTSHGWRGISKTFKRKYGRIPIGIAQKDPEFEAMLHLFKSMSPKKMIEIGVWRGGTMFYWTKFGMPDIAYLGLDIDLQPVVDIVRENLNVRLIEMDTTDPDSQDKIPEDMREIDFLFIDGLHTYEACKADFENFSPLVREGGIIAFHDITRGSEEYAKEVPKFWQEIKQDYRQTTELVCMPENLGPAFGIGVLWNEKH